VLAGACSLTHRGAAQSLSIEEEEPEPEPTSPRAPVKPEPEPPRAPAVIVMPTALTTPLSYPEGAQGEASVALELTLTAEGSVTEARAIEGDEPFASVAVAAARSWTFQPATRDGKPIAAKIRYLVRFVPPREIVEPEPEPAAPNLPPASPSSGSPAAPVKPAEPTYEIVVVGERAPIRHELARTEIDRLPGAFGDPYRAIEALPGVVPIVSGLPYFYVRGAPPGNVGYFFDGIPVPFLYHFAAGPGVFHPAFVDRVDLYPGAYPVRYGRFAGAIVAGEMAPPSYRERAEWKIRIIDSGGMMEAPFAGGRGSAMVGGRFSYTGFVLSLVVPEVTVGYWDYQARVRYDLDADDSIELVSFGSNDFITNTEEQTVQTPNGGFTTVERKNTIVDVNFHRLDLRWDHKLERGKWRNALMLGRDRSGLADGQINVYNYMVGARSELQQQLTPEIQLRAGADALFETLTQEIDTDENVEFDGDATNEPGAPPGQGTPGNDFPEEREDEEPDFGFNRRRKDFTVGVYADLVWDIAPKLQVVPGLRLDLYVSGSSAALGFDPRITAEYELSKKLKVVHGLALVHQTPSFVAAVPGFKPSLAGGLQTAVQHSAGVNYTLPAGFSSSLAVFQSAFYDMTDLISLIQLEQTANEDQEGDVVDFRTGGHAYGVEFMLRRSLSRRLGGFLSYTLSRSERFTRRLKGPATTDRTHVLNLAASYDLGKDWRLGGRLLFYSGIPAQVAYLEAARHPPRTPPFWRVDFKLEKRWYVKRPNQWWGFNIEVLNTTFNKEQLSGSCNAYDCEYEEIGPVSVPSIAFEGAF
jgi:TonB family protein